VKLSPTRNALPCVIDVAEVEANLAGRAEQVSATEDGAVATLGGDDHLINVEVTNCDSEQSCWDLGRELDRRGGAIGGAIGILECN